jgi:hypothetical protein
MISNGGISKIRHKELIDDATLLESANARFIEKSESTFHSLKYTLCIFAAYYLTNLLIYSIQI